MYGKIGVIYRTIGRPWGLVDVQALKPACWCSLCGGEVYGGGLPLCLRCVTMHEGNEVL